MRRKMMIRAALLLTLVIAVFFICQTGIIPGLDPEVDAAVEADKRRAYNASVKEGRISDGNGEPVTVVSRRKTGGTDNGSGDGSEERDDLAVCLYPEAYNWLGHSSEIYGQEGFRYLQREILFTPEGDTEICLNTRNRLQQYCYELLEGKKGAVVVLENRTGKVLAMAGRGDETVAYNVNAIDEEGMKKTYDQVEGLYMNQVLIPDAPGSVFKIVTASALCENGLSDYRFDDSGGYNGVVNAGGAYYGEIGLKDAFVWSVNTYFAAAADKLGAGKLEEEARKFGIGKDLQLDFGTLRSNLDLEYYQDKRLNEDTAYGQGRTLLSPVHMAMILSTVVNGGVMYKPYVIDMIRKGDEVVKKNEPEILPTELDAFAMDEVKSCLHTAALDYGFGEEEFGRIYAKTGTAETSRGMYHIYLAAANEEYTIVYSENDTMENSYDLVPAVMDLFRYISE